MDQNSDYAALRDDIMSVPQSSGLFKRTATMLDAVTDMSRGWPTRTTAQVSAHRGCNDYWRPLPETMAQGNESAAMLRANNVTS